MQNNLFVKLILILKLITMKIVMRVIALVMLLSLSNGAIAQGFLKKLSKAADNLTSALEVDNSNETVENDSIDVKALLADKISFSVMKVYEMDDVTGDTLRNEDGTAKLRYHIVDSYGNVCSVNKAKEIVSKRTKEVTKILAKVGGTALMTGVSSALKGSKKKEVIKDTAMGAVVGLAMSEEEINNVKNLNKELSAYKKTIEAYEKTFNEEGEMIDASVDLSDIDGIDFENVEAMSKSTAEIMKGLEDESDAGSLDDIEL